MFRGVVELRLGEKCARVGCAFYGIFFIVWIVASWPGARVGAARRTDVDVPRICAAGRMSAAALSAVGRWTLDDDDASRIHALICRPFQPARRPAVPPIQ
jgi:hypothetical protein